MKPTNWQRAAAVLPMCIALLACGETQYTGGVRGAIDTGRIDAGTPAVRRVRAVTHLPPDGKRCNGESFCEQAPWPKPNPKKQFAPGAGGRSHEDRPESAEQVAARDERPWLPRQTVRFGAAGDFGGRDDFGGTVMTDMLTRDLSAFFLLGDMSYSEIVPEQAWCDWVHRYLGTDYPVQVIAGNHEEDQRQDGHILKFAECMPDRLNSELGPGGYSVNFASDLGPVTFIATSPNLSIAGALYTYAAGTSERNWLVNTIDTAKQKGDWVVVGMHKNCISIGDKSCEIGPELPQLLIDRGVHLVLQGHDHNYQRTHGLKTVVENGAGVVGDTGDDAIYDRNAGTVFVIVGTAGRGVTHCSHEDSEFGNFAAHWCGEEATDTKGYLVLSANSSQLTGQYVATTGTRFEDIFVIK